MIDRIREISLRFIEKYIPSCNAAMVTGSATSSNMSENADIDLLVLDDNITRDYFETLYFDGFKFDCIIMPSVIISDILNGERKRNNIVYIDMLSKGVILRDNSDVLLNLKGYAIELKDAGPIQADIHTRKTVLFQAYNLFDDLIEDREWNETLFIAMDLFQYLIFLNNTFHTYWTSKGKWKYRYLNKFDKDFAVSIVDSFAKFIEEKDKSDFLYFAKKNLLSFGKPPKQNTSRFYSFVIENGLLTISTKTSASNKTVYECLLKELKERLKLYESSIQLFYVFNDGSILDESNYLIFVEGTNEILNYIISPVVMSLFNDRNNILQDNDIISSLNYYLEPHSLFINHDLYELIKPILWHFNKIHDWMGGINENRILTYLTQFHLYLGSVLGFSTSMYIEFNKYLLEQWIPFSIDSSRRASFKEVERAKMLKLEEYGKIFEDQKEHLVRNFSGIYEDWMCPNFDYLDDYISEGILLFGDFYNKLDNSFFNAHCIPQFKLSQIRFDISDFEKRRWISLVGAMNIVYSSILLSAEQKSYLSFACSSLSELFVDNSVLNAK